MTGRDVAGSSPVRTSSRGITGSTRDIGHFSAKNATEPSLGLTTLHCTWNGIYNQNWKTPNKVTSEPRVAFEQESTKLHDKLCCPQHQGGDLSFFFVCFFPFLSLSSNMLVALVRFLHTGTILECASTYRQSLEMPSAKLKTGNIWISGIHGNIRLYVLKRPLIDLHSITQSSNTDPSSGLFCCSL